MVQGYIWAIDKGYRSTICGVEMMDLDFGVVSWDRNVQPFDSPNMRQHRQWGV